MTENYIQRCSLLYKTMIMMGIVLLGATACSTTSGPVTDDEPGTVKKESVMQMQTGMVTAVKQVAVLAKRSGIGNTAGRTVGSIVGGSIGSGYGSIAGSIFGGFVGGTVGSKADEDLRRQPGLEITVRLQDGEHVTVTQLAKEGDFKPGDQVKLIMKDGVAQVQHQS